MNVEPSVVTTAGAALFGFLFVVAFFFFREPEERKFLLPLAAISFLLKAAFVPIYYAMLVNVGLGGFEFEDSIKYHYRGVEFGEELARGIDFKSQAWRTLDPGYPILTGIVYWMIGVNTLAIRILNCVISVVALLWVYRMARLAFEDVKAARYACYLVAFLPYPILFVVTHRKDALVAALATFIFYQAMRVLRFDKSTTNAAAWMVGSLALMSVFRSGFVLPFIAGLFVCYMLTQRSLFQAFFLSIPTVMALALAQIFISSDASVGVAANVERFEGKFLRSAGLASSSGLVSYFRMTSIYEIYKLPFAVPLVLILPFPPEFRGSLPTVMLSWAVLGNVAFLPHMLVGMMMSLSRTEWKKRIPLLILPGVFLVLLAAIHIGVIRYRELIYPTLLILAGAGLARGGNGFFSAVVYFALAMLTAVVFFVRYY